MAARQFNYTKGMGSMSFIYLHYRDSGVKYTISLREVLVSRNNENLILILAIVMIAFELFACVLSLIFSGIPPSVMTRSAADLHRGIFCKALSLYYSTVETDKFGAS